MNRKEHPPMLHCALTRALTQAVREREAFNKFLWCLEDPGAGVVARRLKPLQRLVGQLVDSWRYPNPTPAYLVLNK